jgi:DNA-binding transcriptional LysR family regulator
MPSLHVQDGVKAGRLVRIFSDWSSRAGHIHLVYPSRQQPERARLLVEFLLEAFSKIASV